jgi:serine/threonine-protein kinase
MATGDFEGTVAGYTLVGEIARGGMGIVYRAYDLGVDRDVAIKVLQESFRGSPSAVQRFIEEGQTTGQLQHPGIPAIHQIGYLPDGSPFLAMKLIQGQTLSELLQNPDHDRAAFVPAFRKIAETVAYAHSRGVIHRDLKPANVMIGAFGEVQVMDWGIAKQLSRSGFQPDRREGSGWKPDLQGTDATADYTPAGGTAEDRTTVGQIVGTPAYMAPEQARGEISRVDERADVFALGGILLRLLTGSATFTGRGDEAIAAARTGQLGPAFAKLDRCGADPELVALAKRCLDPVRERRPKDADAVASAVAALQAAAEERARRAEVDRVRAETQAAGERKRRRVQVALAAAVIGILLLGGGGWAWMSLESRARTANAERGVSVAHEKADQLQTQAGRLDLGTVAGAETAVSLWQQALAAAEQADGAATNGNDDGLKARAAARTALVKEGLKSAEGALGRATREATLLADLEAAHGMMAQTAEGIPNAPATARAYARAFAAAALPKPEEPVAMAKAIRAERAPIRAALVAALDEWAGLEAEVKYREQMRAAADEVDQDALRKEVRVAIATPDSTSARKLAQDNANLSAPAAALLGDYLRRAGAHDEAERVLRRAADNFPTDFWILEYLGAVLTDRGWSDPRKAAESVGCRRAAVALRPTSAIAWNGLGLAHAANGHLSEAETCISKALRLDDKLTWAHINYGNTLKRFNDLRTAEESYRKALKLEPDNATALTNLGNVFALRGDFRQAEGFHKKAIEMAPWNGLPRNNLGDTLMRGGDMDGAVKQFQQAVDLDPNGVQSRDAHCNLGLVLARLERFAEAEKALRKAVLVDPTGARGHVYLIETLFQQASWEEARDAARLAVARVPPTDPLYERLESSLDDGNDVLRVASQIPAALAGGDPSANPQERRVLITACRQLRHYVDAVRLSEAALATDPDWKLRYNLACFYIGIAGGHDVTCKSISADEAAYLLGRAYEMLSAVLKSRVEIAERPTRWPAVAKTMRQWKEDLDLLSIRNPDWLLELPESDRERWQQFWADVDALLERVTSWK